MVSVRADTLAPVGGTGRLPVVCLICWSCYRAGQGGESGGLRTGSELSGALVWVDG